MKVKVRWQVTEEHEAVIDVDDPSDLDANLDDSVLAEHEGNESYQETPDRTLLSWEEVDPTPCCPDPGCGGNPCTFPGYADNH